MRTFLGEDSSSIISRFKKYIKRSTLDSVHRTTAASPTLNIAGRADKNTVPKFFLLVLVATESALEETLEDICATKVAGQVGGVTFQSDYRAGVG